ncbi:protein of unknown function [Paraburkholderia kururiensis]
MKAMKAPRFTRTNDTPNAGPCVPGGALSLALRVDYSAPPGAIQMDFSLSDTGVFSRNSGLFHDVLLP